MVCALGIEKKKSQFQRFNWSVIYYKGTINLENNIQK